MFAEEKPSLLPLPLEPFRYYQHGQQFYGNDEITCGNSYSTLWDETLEHKVEHNNCRTRGPEPDKEASSPTVSA